MNKPPIKFPATKGAGNYCRDRTHFLVTRTGVEEADLSKKHGLCNALANINGPLGTGANNADFLAPDLPWLTLILGSGCSSESTEGAMWLSADSISACLNGEANLPDKRRPGDVVRSFVQSLLLLRDPNIEQSSHGEVKLQGDWTRAARLLLVTALLTQLYHEAAAVLVRPLHPKANDRVFIQPGPQLRGEYMVRLIGPIKIHIKKLQHGGGLSKAVSKILKIVALKLDDASVGYIDQLDLQILTEFSWLELTAWSTVYPGWSDLLADLVRRKDPFSDNRPYGTPLRPTFSRETLIEQITLTYMTVTKDSWRMRRENEVTDRQKFYDSAARVLLAQAGVKSQAVGNKAPPAACAFSTSFDLELEMALASAMAGREVSAGFIIALPVYLQSRSSLEVGQKLDAATFSWIGAVIRPKAEANSIELDDILVPRKWISFNDPRVAHFNWEYANLPCVVHLAGSPLIALPSVEDATATLTDLPRPGDTNHLAKPERVMHALLLDEYDAMQQHSSEIFAKGPRPGKPIELPDLLIGARGTMVAKERYWMVMGVQMDDAAVRHRVASRLGVASVERLGDPKSSDPPKLPTSAGLVVVKKIGPAAQELLRWFGVDVVESASGCSDFRGDLDHYAEHFEKRKRMSTDPRGCELLK